MRPTQTWRETSTDGDDFDRHDRYALLPRPPKGTRWVYCHKPGWQTPSGRDDWRWEPVDLGVADIVERLQGDDKPFTAGACDGHGKGLADILLADGRRLVVLEDENAPPRCVRRELPVRVRNGR
jgi:hypothetical protein